MVTLYRLIDTEDNKIVAQGLDANDAYELLQMYQLEYPDVRFEVESYQQSAVRPGFGRDPDLH